MYHAPLQSGGNQREAIKYALRIKGVTLADIANDLNISGATVSIVLTGERRSRRVAEYVASVLDSTVDELFPGIYTNREARS